MLTVEKIKISVAFWVLIRINIQKTKKQIFFTKEEKMKKEMKKWMAVLLSMMLACLVLAGCGDEPDDFVAEDFDEEEFVEEEPEYTEEAEAPEEVKPEETEAKPEEAENVEASENTESTETVDKGAGKEGSSGFCFSGKDMEGNPVNTADVFAKNKVTLVNMWASWCGPCVGEIPELQKMKSELEAKGCGIMGIMLDGEDPDGLEDGLDILQEANVTYLNVIGSDSMWEDFGMDAIPTTFFVDSNGKALGDPVVGADPDEYRKRIDQLLK